MLRVERVNKRLGDFRIENISFELKKGYIMGLVGTNGAGKTTLMKMILGMLKPELGEIKIFNKSLEKDEIFIKNNIGFVFDELNFYQHLKVKDFERIVKSFYLNFNSNIFNDYLKKFNIDKKAYIGNLSKGQGMRLMLANALSHDAKLLILDEPTSGLDPIVRKEMLSILQDVIEDGKRSVLFSTHITSDLDGIADYITFIDNGRLIFSEDILSLKEKHKLLIGTKDTLNNSGKEFINVEETEYYCEGLYVEEKNIDEYGVNTPTLEEIMYHFVKGNKYV